ncbi:hypothetical protein ATCC90586_002286 [Pythium insidiosum]|nr:hypothetical protein ATCC90586_002286 [Pythium insidiosum]
MDAWTERFESAGNQRLSEDARRKAPELSSSASSIDDSPQSDSDDAPESKTPSSSSASTSEMPALDDSRKLEGEQDSIETRYEQLRQDVDVLVAHLEKQTLEMENERAAMASARLQQQHALEAMARERESLRVERDALRAQNELLCRRQEELSQRETSARETHEELLVALKSQQQRDEQSRTLVMHFIKERDALRKQLDESKSYSRRVEEELVTVRAEAQQLRAEHAALTVSLRAASANHGERESRREQEQARLIESLRADLLQMEFELQTLSVDRDKLTQRVTSLQRQQQSSRSSYEVISLSANATKNQPDKAQSKKRLTVVTAASTATGGSHKDAPTFSNLMTLPNFVDESGDGQTTASRATPHRRSPVGSLMSKTISSARKRLFRSSSKATTVLPQ